jgi:hypothetical protein
MQKLILILLAALLTQCAPRATRIDADAFDSATSQDVIQHDIAADRREGSQI